MVKSAKKRTGRAQKPIQIPLGEQTFLEDAEKDDEERRLESLLFGTDDIEDLQNDDTEQDGGLENLNDADLFYFDDVTLANTGQNGSSRSSQGGQTAETSTNQNPGLASLFSSKTRRPGAAAWSDPDDATLTISLATDKRLRKLRDAQGEDEVAGEEYEGKLRRQYENINPTPQWATSARKRRRYDSAADLDPIQKLVSSTDGILADSSTTTLPQGTLGISRLRDANQAEKTEGEIRTVMFHPSPAVPVLLVAGSDRRLRLFNIDGHTNPHLQTLHIPELPFSSAVYHPSGSHILLAGPRPFYYTYDLQSGACVRSPRGLWGSASSAPSNADQSLEINAYSPEGDVLAVAGRRGYVHLIDWKSGGAQVIGNVKMNSAVKALWWTPGDSKELLTLGEDAQVYVWDTRSQRCIHRWKDDGGFGSCVMAGDQNAKYLGVASRTGFVNIYNSSSTTLAGADPPQPLKTLGHLTTPISLVRFNHDSQLLAIASKAKKDQLRMIHLPSLTAMSNWPTSGTPLGQVNTLDFSTGSEYLAVGNNRGRVLLWNLQHYVRR